MGKLYTCEADVDADLVRQCAGFALDIGGSAVKFVYRTKAEWDRLQDKAVTRGKLTFLTCGRPDLDAAIDHVKAHAHITGSAGAAATGSTPKVYSCGVGGFQYNDRLQKGLGIEIENCQEGDCLLEGFAYFMRSVSEADLVHPPCSKAIAKITETMQSMVKMAEKSNETQKHKFVPNEIAVASETSDSLSTTKSLLDLKGEAAIFPNMYVQLGSAYVWMGFAALGDTPVVSSFSNVGGRSFLGVASLLTGAESYEELVDLAEKGNNWAVDQSIASLIPKAETSDKDDPYAQMVGVAEMDEQMCFSFGHAVFKKLSDFRREDVAAAWVLAHLQWVAQATVLSACEQRVRNVFISGSLANRAHVRELLTREIFRLKLTRQMYRKDAHDFEVTFLKIGGHTGSFGALMNSVKKFTISKADTEPTAQSNANNNSNSDSEEEVTHL